MVTFYDIPYSVLAWTANGYIGEETSHEVNIHLFDYQSFVFF
jgi:hypothetical protein